MTKPTGWDTGLSQDYDRKLGAWFADRLGAKQQLREDVECKPHCDLTNPVMRGRATWLCRKCGRDFSLEYLFWYQADQKDTNNTREPI